MYLLKGPEKKNKNQPGFITWQGYYPDGAFSAAPMNVPMKR